MGRDALAAPQRHRPSQRGMGHGRDRQLRALTARGRASDQGLVPSRREGRRTGDPHDVGQGALTNDLCCRRCASGLRGCTAGKSDRSTGGLAVTPCDARDNTLRKPSIGVGLVPTGVIRLSVHQRHPSGRAYVLRGGWHTRFTGSVDLLTSVARASPVVRRARERARPDRSARRVSRARPRPAGRAASPSRLRPARASRLRVAIRPGSRGPGRSRRAYRQR